MTTNNEIRRSKLWIETEDEWNDTVRNYSSLLYKEQFRDRKIRMSKEDKWICFLIFLITLGIMSVFQAFGLLGSVIIFFYWAEATKRAEEEFLNKKIEKEMYENPFFEAQLLLLCEMNRIPVSCDNIRNKIYGLAESMTERNYTEYHDLIWYILPECFDVKTDDLNRSKLHGYLNKLEKTVKQKYSEVSPVALLNEYIDLC